METAKVLHTIADGKAQMKHLNGRRGNIVLPFLAPDTLSGPHF